MAFHDDFGLSQGPNLNISPYAQQMSQSGGLVGTKSQGSPTGLQSFLLGANNVLGNVSNAIGGSMGLGSLASSVIGTVGSIIQQNKQNKFNAEQAQLARDFNADEAQKTRDFSLDMWNKQNEYNDPSAQYDRLKQLGFADSTISNMMSGSGAAAGTASPVQSSAQAQGSSASSAGMPSDLGRYMADIPMAILGAQEKQQNIISQKLDNRMKKFDAEHQWEQYQIQLEQQMKTLEGMDYANEYAQYQNVLAQYDISKQDYELGMLINQYAMSSMDAAAHQQFLDLSLRIQAAEAEIRETQSQFERDRLMAEIEQMRATASNMYAQAALAGAQQAGVDLENQMREFDARHQGDRYNREVGEYEQRMKNYRTERTMSIATGITGSLCNIASTVAQFLPTSIISNTIGQTLGKPINMRTSSTRHIGK